MSPEDILRFSIGGIVLLGAFGGLFVVPNGKRAYLAPFWCIGGYFILSGLLSVLT